MNTLRFIRIFENIWSAQDLQQHKATIFNITNKVKLFEHRPEYQIMLIEATTELRNLPELASNSSRACGMSLNTLYIRSLTKLYIMSMLTIGFISVYRPFDHPVSHPDVLKIELSPETLSLILPGINFHGYPINVYDPYVQDFYYLYSTFLDQIIPYVDAWIPSWKTIPMGEHFLFLVDSAKAIQPHEHRNEIGNIIQVLETLGHLICKLDYHDNNKIMFLMCSLYSICKITVDRIDEGRFTITPFRYSMRIPMPKDHIILDVNGHDVIEDEPDDEPEQPVDQWGIPIPAYKPLLGLSPIANFSIQTPTPRPKPTPTPRPHLTPPQRMYLLMGANPLNPITPFLVGAYDFLYHH
jgi:hypothetical protein